MPKIDAPTVAEHRALREKAVITAAVDLLVTEGGAAVTPGAVAREAGLARTSVYQYFPSTGALLGAALEALARQCEHRLTRAVAEAGADPRDRIGAYVRTRVLILHDSATPGVEQETSTVPADVRERLRSFEERSSAPLRDAVRDLGVDDPATVATLIEGTLAAASALLTSSSSDDAAVDAVAATVTRFALAGVDAPKLS